MRIGIRDWEMLSRAEREALQMRRLRRLLQRQILPFSPFYRSLFDAGYFDVSRLKSLDDLRRLPFTSKQDLLVSEERPQGPRDFVLQPDETLIRERLPLRAKLPLLARKLFLGSDRLRRRLLWEYNPSTLIFTTGRSTGSIPVFITPYDHELLLETGRRIAHVLRLEPGKDRVFNAFPYAPHLAFWQVAACGMASGVLTLNTGGGRIMGAERLLGGMERIKPTLIVGMPGYMYHLLRRAAEEQRDLSSIRLVALGGENVPRGLKRRMVELLAGLGAENVRVVSVLGFTEARQCWTECLGGRRTGFHTYPDLSMFEIIDPDTGEPLPEGETGELVYTSLDGRGTLFVRYRTGDIVQGGMVSDTCPGCGRSVPRIASDISRTSNVKSLDIGKVKGTLVNLNAVSAMLADDDEIEEWQLVIGKRNDDPFETDELVLYCALRAGIDEDDFGRGLMRRFHEAAEVNLNGLEIESVESLLERVGMETLTKEERIVDRRSAAQAVEEKRVP